MNKRDLGICPRSQQLIHSTDWKQKSSPRRPPGTWLLSSQGICQVAHDFIYSRLGSYTEEKWLKTQSKFSRTEHWERNQTKVGRRTKPGTKAVIVSVCACACMHAQRSEDSLHNPFSPSTMWVLEIELGSPGWTARHFYLLNHPASRKAINEKLAYCLTLLYECVLAPLVWEEEFRPLRTGVTEGCEPPRGF